MALVSIQEPAKLVRFERRYKPNVKVPIDVSGIFLEDTTPVVVRVFFQNDPEADEFPLLPDPHTVGLWASIKKMPGVHPTLFFTPPVPGIYTVVLIGVTSPVLAVWKCEPVVVVP